MSIERQRVAKKRSKSQINRLLNELRYYRELHKETKDLFYEYDVELNLVLDDITSIVAPESVEKIENSSTQLSLREDESADEKEDLDDNPQKASSEPSNEESKRENDPVSKNSSVPPWMKKLFKKIAIETHPDKVQNRKDLSGFEKKEREVLYKKASNAIENLDEMSLLETAYILEIVPDIPQKQQQDIINFALNEEKNKISSYHSLVAWLWGENFGKIDLRCNLLIYVRAVIGLPDVEAQIISSYIKAFENGEDLSEFKKQYVQKPKNKKRNWRKIGERPAPSFVKSRK